MAKTSTEKLEEALGLNDGFGGEHVATFEVLPVPKRDEKLPTITSEDVEQNKADDYDYARKTMMHLMEQGNEALQGVLKLAAEGPNPRTYEVIATLIKTVSEVSKDLLDVNETMEPKQVEGSNQTAQTINNTQIVTSHADALKLARELNEPK